MDCLVEFFTPKGELLYELIKISKNAEQQKATKVFSKIEQSINLPLRALINYGSASSGEKLAGILQALNIGRVIGQRSLSKGTSMNPVSVASFFDEDVSVMTYSSRHEYLLPGEVKVEGVGVTPDLSLIHI